MLGNKKTTSVDKVDTIIGKETSFQGKITANGTLRIDGQIEGEVISQGDVIIGENGQVAAQVKTRNLIVAGVLKGNVIAAGRAELLASSKLEGDIQVGTLLVEDGAVFLGKCAMTGSTDKAGGVRIVPEDERGD